VTGGLLLCDDLLFASKVTATAAAHGSVVRVCKMPALTNGLTTHPAAVILDLQTPGLDVAGLLAGLGDPRPRVIGFGSHVDKATLDAAKAAGCDEVLPRSKFVKELEENLPRWLS
jgi:DNA-binding NarL/FixJ family response regulator